MERITEHIDYCFLACYEQQGDKIREECPIYHNCYSRQMHEKLSHYEDLEEQGRLIELPCKSGDAVYEILPPCHDILLCEMFRQLRIQRCLNKECGHYIQIKQFRIELLGEFGKTVFLTKEEAEAKLKELKEGVE